MTKDGIPSSLQRFRDLIDRLDKAVFDGMPPLTAELSEDEEMVYLVDAKGRMRMCMSSGDYAAIVEWNNTAKDKQ